MFHEATMDSDRLQFLMKKTEKSDLLNCCIRQDGVAVTLYICKKEILKSNLRSVILRFCVGFLTLLLCA
jgi:hypothetical protein